MLANCHLIAYIHTYIHTYIHSLALQLIVFRAGAGFPECGERRGEAPRTEGAAEARGRKVCMYVCK